MTSVSRTISYVLVSSTFLPSTSTETGNLALHYSAAEPLSVLLDFLDDNPVWTLDRGLLTDGLTRPAGIHDVRCWTEGLWYHIALSGYDGRAELRMFTEQVRAFLAATADVVPYGAEQVDVDAMLAGLLGGAR